MKILHKNYSDKNIKIGLKYKLVWHQFEHEHSLWQSPVQKYLEAFFWSYINLADVGDCKWLLAATSQKFHREKWCWQIVFRGVEVWSMCIGRVLNKALKNFFESLCYLIQRCNNMIMLFFYSTNAVILMQTVSKTVVVSLSIKYWLTSADKIVKFLLKMLKKIRCSFKHCLNHFYYCVLLSELFFAFFFDRSATWVDLTLFVSDENANL